jgi:hypothetical protein
MRRICIALFLSLFASLIHAAVMPIDLSAYQPQHQVTVTDSSAHHCDEMVSNSYDTNTNQLCHGDSYQCCLGFVVLPSFVVALFVAPKKNLTTPHTSLVLKPIISRIYKPPKT